MNRTIEYIITKEDEGLRIEQFLKRRGYSSKNLAAIKRMPKSVLVNGEHFYMRQELKEGDHLSIHIIETESSEKVPPTEIPSYMKMKTSSSSINLRICQFIHHLIITPIPWQMPLPGITHSRISHLYSGAVTVSTETLPVSLL